MLPPSYVELTLNLHIDRSAASKDAETRAKSRLSAVHGGESLRSPDIDKQARRRSALSSSFPSPPESAPTSPLPRTPPAKSPPKRPLSQISLQEVPTALPRVDLQEDDAEGGTETLLEPSRQPDKTEISSRSPTPTKHFDGGQINRQDEVPSPSASPSSPIDSAAMQRPLPPPPSEPRDLPSLPAGYLKDPPAPAMPLRRPATAPASHASRDSFRTASPFPSPTSPIDSRGTSKPCSPAPTSPATPSVDQDTTTASSIHTASTGTSQTGSSKLPPDVCTFILLEATVRVSDDASFSIRTFVDWRQCLFRLSASLPSIACPEARHQRTSSATKAKAAQARKMANAHPRACSMRYLKVTKTQTDRRQRLLIIPPS